MSDREFLKICQAMVNLVEGFPAHEWRSASGMRLKDTPEWVALYVATKKAEREQPPAIGADARDAELLRDMANVLRAHGKHCEVCDKNKYEILRRYDAAQSAGAGEEKS